MPEAELAFLDTHVFLRFLAADHPEQGRRAYALLQRIETGEIIATTSETVIAEIVFVLSSKRTYNRPREEIRARLSDLLSLKGLRLPRKAVYLRALDLYVDHPSIDFVDCLNVAHMEQAGISTLWTFDRDYQHFRGLTGIQPREP